MYICKYETLLRGNHNKNPSIMFVFHHSYPMRMRMHNAFNASIRIIKNFVMRQNVAIIKLSSNSQPRILGKLIYNLNMAISSTQYNKISI